MILLDYTVRLKMCLADSVCAYSISPLELIKISNDGIF